jgi:hypothetical protein
MAVRFENQKWKKTVIGIGREEIEVIFKGEGAIEQKGSVKYSGDLVSLNLLQTLGI